MNLPFKTPVIISRSKDLPEFKILLNSKPDTSTRKKKDLRAVGLKFLSVGLIPTPLIGKRPIIKNWQNTTEEDAIKIISQSSGYNNLGILTGKNSGITVVDIDGEEGLKNFKKILESIEYDSTEDIKNWFDTYIVKTGNNGYHIYFKYIGKKLNSGPLRWSKSNHLKIDIKNDGGQVVSAGSIHPDTNKEYLQISENGPDVISKMPKILLKTLESLQIT